jgi:hypothetical protein
VPTDGRTRLYSKCDTPKICNDQRPIWKWRTSFIAFKVQRNCHCKLNQRPPLHIPIEQICESFKISDLYAAIKICISSTIIQYTIPHNAISLERAPILQLLQVSSHSINTYPTILLITMTFWKRWWEPRGIPADPLSRIICYKSRCSTSNTLTIVLTWQSAPALSVWSRPSSLHWQKHTRISLSLRACVNSGAQSLGHHSTKQLRFTTHSVA